MSATALAPIENRAVVRCDACTLVQFRGKTPLCRRCHRSLKEEVPQEQESSVLPKVITSTSESTGLVVCLPQLLRELRIACGLKSVGLAKRISVPRTYISKIENGGCTPGFWSFERYAWALGTRGSSLAAVIENPTDRCLAKPFNHIDKTIAQYVGPTIKRLRNESGQNKGKFERSTGIAASYLCNVEGSKIIPLLPFFERFAAGIGKTVSVVFAEIENAAYPDG